jgi:hypothetical protein
MQCCYENMIGEITTDHTMLHLRTLNILTRPAGFPPADRRLSAGCLTALAAHGGVVAGLNGPQPVSRGRVELSRAAAHRAPPSLRALPSPVREPTFSVRDTPGRRARPGGESEAALLKYAKKDLHLGTPCL